MELKKTNKKTLIQRFFIFFTGIILFSGNVLYAQNYNNLKWEDQTWKDKIFYGGQFGIGSQWEQTHFFLSPLIGYDVWKRATIAVGPIYNYFKSSFVNDKADHIFGEQIFTRVRVYQNFYVQGQYERLHLKKSYLDNFDQEPENNYQSYPVYLVGGGYSLPVMEKGRLNLTFLWDIGSKNYIPYNSPLVHIGFTYYFMRKIKE